MQRCHNESSHSVPGQGNAVDMNDKQKKNINACGLALIVFPTISLFFVNWEFGVKGRAESSGLRLSAEPSLNYTHQYKCR